MKRQTTTTDERHIQDSVVENYEQLRYKLPYARTYHDWWLREMIGLTSSTHHDNTILDNGCGTGILLQALSGFGSAYGVDLSLGMLTKASQNSKRVTQGDSLRLPFADNQFDLIFARALIHHLPSPEDGIQEMVRILKPGGQMILADTNQSILSTIPRKIAYRRENFSEDHANLHYRDYLGWIEDYAIIQKVQFFGYLAYPFGFPDMLGKLRDIPYPVALIKTLIRIDSILARIPFIKTQSWGIIVSATKSLTHTKDITHQPNISTHIEYTRNS